MMTPLEHAHHSLIGLSVADALGGFFEFGSSQNAFIRERCVPNVELWRYTDDTNMALSIYEQLRLHGEIKQDELAQSFADHFDQLRGYGMGARKLLKSVAKGEEWQEVSRNMFRGSGSFGNGGAMRIAPLGAYFADDLAACIDNARKATEITHAHPEGIAGGIAIAVAAAYAVQSIGQDKPEIETFITQVIEQIPEGDVKDNCVKASKITIETPIDVVVSLLGNGSKVSAMDTVPIALWSAVKWFDDFEEGFWQLASVGGDVDTTCAIMGGIIGSRSIARIPEDWIKHREALPPWAIG